MSREEKIEIIADILEEDVDSILEDKELLDYDNWDSVAILSVISVVNENTGKFLHASDIEKLVTVADLMKVLGD